MYLLTKEENNIDSGAYATLDRDGIIVIQFFVDKDDAECYRVQLEAIDEHLHVTEVPDDHVDKMCDSIGHAYSVVNPGEVVYPRIETLQKNLSNLFDA